jgi:hypothetical protein
MKVHITAPDRPTSSPVGAPSPDESRKVCGTRGPPAKLHSFDVLGRQRGFMKTTPLLGWARSAHAHFTTNQCHPGSDSLCRIQFLT